MLELSLSRWHPSWWLHVWRTVRESNDNIFLAMWVWLHCVTAHYDLTPEQPR